MSSVRDQLETARAHIKAKRYTEARRILTGMRHPTAVEYLAKLDKIDRAFQAKVKAKQKANRRIILVFVLIGIVIIGITGGVIYTNLESIARQELADDRASNRLQTQAALQILELTNNAHWTQVYATQTAIFSQ